MRLIGILNAMDMMSSLGRDWLVFSSKIHDTCSKSAFDRVFLTNSHVLDKKLYYSIYTIKLFLDLFNALPPGLQRSMLLSAAESVKDPLHQCRLLLLVVDRYPAQVEEQGVISYFILVVLCQLYSFDVGDVDGLCHNISWIWRKPLFSSAAVA